MKRSQRRLRRGVSCLAAALATLAAMAPAAWPHASFVGSSPAPGQRLGSSPSQLTLTFSEPLNSGLSEVELVDSSSGERIEAKSGAAGARRLALRPAASLPRGAYVVRWRTVSTTDGHLLEGSFSFGVRAPAAAAGAHSEPPLGGGGWLRAAVRALLYALALLFAGGTLLRVLLDRDAAGWLAPPGAPRRTEIARRGRILLGDLGLFAAAAAALSAIVESAQAADGLSAAALHDYLLTNTAGLARIAVVALLLAGAWLAPRSRALGAVFASAALGAIAFAGHARSASPASAAIVTDVVHLLAGAVWLGGAALIALVWAPALRRDREAARRALLRDVLPVFGAVALPAFVVVAVTGTLNAVIELGRVAALWTTAYGVVLLVKIALVALLALASYLHAMRLRPRMLAANPHPPAALERRHWRLLRGEPLLALGVIAAVGVLVAFPLPPHQARAAARRVQAAVACSPCAVPRPHTDELAVAEQAGSRIVAGWLARTPAGLDVTLRLIDYHGQPVGAPLAVAGGARRGRCGVGCARFTLAGSPASVRVVARERGRAYAALLPARWSPRGAAGARALLERAEATMRALRSVRERELITSGPGTRAIATYYLRAPDRLAYTTGDGAQTVVVGRTQYLRGGRGPWQRSAYPGGAPFTTASWFRWTPYATSVQLLARNATQAELALMDPGTPVWSRLTIDVVTDRVLSERLIAPARFVDHRFYDFDRPLAIAAPRVAG